MLKIVEYLWAVGDPAPNPAWRAHSASPDPLALGTGLLPVPKKPTLALRLPSWPPMKNPGHSFGCRVATVVCTSLVLGFVAVAEDLAIIIY